MVPYRRRMTRTLTRRAECLIFSQIAQPFKPPIATETFLMRSLVSQNQKCAIARSLRAVVLEYRKNIRQVRISAQVAETSHDVRFKVDSNPTEAPKRARTYMSDSNIEGNVLYSTLGDDPDFGELVSMFVDEMPDRIALLEASFQQANRDELRRAAHQMKGAAGSYGFQPLTELAARLENAVQDGKTEQEIVESLTELLSVCRKIRAGSPDDVAH